MDPTARYSISAALVDGQASIFESNCCYTAAAALVLWYYLLTLGKEVEFFWKRRPSGACALFFANRYLTLVLVLYNSTWWPAAALYTRGCAALIFEQCFLPYSQYVVWAAFASLRVYALGKQRCVAAVVFVLSLAIVLTNVLQAPYAHTRIDPDTQACIADYDVPLVLIERLCILSRGSLVVAETIVLVVTWATMRDQYRGQRVLRVHGRKLTLSSVFYENGRIYFVLTTLAYTLDLVVEVLPDNATKMAVMHHAYMVLSPAEPLVGLFVDHFLIELQEAASSAPGSSLSEDTFSGIEFPGVNAAGPVGLVGFARADIDKWTLTQWEDAEEQESVGSGEADSEEMV